MLNAQAHLRLPVCCLLSVQGPQLSPGAKSDLSLFQGEKTPTALQATPSTRLLWSSAFLPADSSLFPPIPDTGHRWKWASCRNLSRLHLACPPVPLVGFLEPHERDAGFTETSGALQ